MSHGLTVKNMIKSSSYWIAAVICFLILVSQTPVIAAEVTHLTLEQALEKAAANHPNLRVARESISQATSQFRSSQSAYYPQLNLNSGANRSKSGSSNENSSYSYSVSASQLLFDFGKTPALVKESKANIEIQKLNYTKAELSIYLNVKTAYYGLVAAREQLKIAQDTLESSNLHLKLAKVSYEVGKVAKLDVTKAEVEVANSQLTLTNAKNNYQIAVRNLNNTMGLDANSYEDLVVMDPPIAKNTKNISSLIETAQANRPDIVSYKYQKEQLSNALYYVRHGHYPSVSASGSAGQSGNSMPLNDSWSVGLSIGMNLFDGMKTEQQSKVYESQIRALNDTYQKSIQDLQLEVTTDYLNIKNGEEKITNSQVLVKQAKESLDLAKGRYENGLGTILDLTDAQVSYTNAQVSLTQAILDYQISYAKLLSALGEK